MTVASGGAAGQGRTSQPTGLRLYETMVRMRAVEHAQNDLWRRGLVSGEMHTGIGEEGVVAGVVDHLVDGDAIACDHRPTGPFVARGVDPAAILLEMLGHPDGLGGGRAGHMHLMDRPHLAISDGIVGSSGPGACGFALAGLHERPGKVAVAFFGEGALNQGMMMEALNLAAVWKLPVLFVCKDNGWSITTRSRSVTAGRPRDRAAAFGIEVERVHGVDVRRVHRTAGRMITRMRRRPGPAFLHASCVRPDGHFLGDPVLRVLDDPGGEGRRVIGPLAGAAVDRDGATMRRRLGAALGLGRRLAGAALDRVGRDKDPLSHTRRDLDDAEAAAVDRRVTEEVAAEVAAVLDRAGVAPDA